MRLHVLTDVLNTVILLLYSRQSFVHEVVYVQQEGM